MTLTDRCWKTDFLLSPADICLSPRVCSCTDQIVKDGSQMLGMTADETRPDPAHGSPFSPEVTHLKFKTIFQHFTP